MNVTDKKGWIRIHIRIRWSKVPYGSEDPHPDPYQNITDPVHCFLEYFFNGKGNLCQACLFFSFFVVFCTRSVFVRQIIALQSKHPRLFYGANSKSFFPGGFFSFFFLVLFYSTLLQGPSQRFYCVGECWDRTWNCCDFSIGSQTLGNHLARSSEAIQYFYKYFLFQHGHELVRSHCALRYCGEGCDEPEPGTGPPRHSRGGGPAAPGRLLRHFGRHLGRLHAGRDVQSPCQHCLAALVRPRHLWRSGHGIRFNGTLAASLFASNPSGTCSPPRHLWRSGHGIRYSGRYSPWQQCLFAPASYVNKRPRYLLAAC